MTDDNLLEAIQLSVSLPRGIVEEMDIRRKEEFKNRSEYIKDLILVDLNQRKLKLA